MLEKFKISIKKYWYVYLAIITLNIIRVFNQTTLSHYPHGSIEYKIHFFSIWLGLWLLSGISLFFAVYIYKNKSKPFWIVSIITILIALYYLILPVYVYREINKGDKELDILHQKIDSLRKISKK